MSELPPLCHDYGLGDGAEERVLHRLYLFQRMGPSRSTVHDKIISLKRPRREEVRSGNTQGADTRNTNRRLHPRNTILIQPHFYLPSLSTLRRMIRLINLHSTFHRLDHPKEEGHPNNQCHSQPKIIPLHRLPSVTPPTLESPWLCFVEDLLEDDETVPPVVEVFNLTSFCG